MSDSEKAQPSSLFANAGLVGIGGLVLYKLTQPVWMRLVALWHLHPALCAAIVILVGTSVLALLFGELWNRTAEHQVEKEVTAEDETSVYLGKTDRLENIHLKQKYRTTHTQVIGTTSAGKTESVILPWAIRDLETKAGVLIIDGKSDKTFLEKFYGYVVRSGRSSDFRLFSLANIGASSTFNPLVGGTSYEVAERVFSAFKFENEYFRNVQYKL